MRRMIHRSHVHPRRRPQLMVVSIRPMVSRIIVRQREEGRYVVLVVINVAKEVIREEAE